MPQVCGRDRLGVQKPCISGFLAGPCAGDDGGRMRIPAIDYSSDDITQVIRNLMVRGQLCASTADGNDSANDAHGSDSQSNISDFELVANSLVIEADNGVSDWNLV